MKNLWTFGDCFTYGFRCRPDSHYTDYHDKYKKEGDDIWVNLLAKKLNLTVKNCSRTGMSNFLILEKMMDYYPYINEGDIVILGKTLYQRFEIPSKTENTLWDVGPLYLTDMKLPVYDESEKYLLVSSEEIVAKKVCQTKKRMNLLIDFIIQFRDDPLYKEQQDKWFFFMKNLFIKEKKVGKFITWSTSDLFNEKHETSSFEKIFQHTNFEIDDPHLSFKGHKQMYEYFYNKLK